MAEKGKRITFALDADLVDWVSFAAGLCDTSHVGYINDAVRRDMEAATPEAAEAFGAFVKARQAGQVTDAERRAAVRSLGKIGRAHV